MTSRNYLGSTGLRTYDYARLIGDERPQASHVHVDVGMSSLWQRGLSMPERSIEIEVPGDSSVLVLLVRLRNLGRQPCRIAGRPHDFRLLPGLCIALPPGCDSWWGCDAVSLDGWFHLHFSQSLLQEAALTHGCRFDQARTFQDARLLDLTEHARDLLDTATTPHPLLWESLAVLLLHRLAQCLQARPTRGMQERLTSRQAERVIDYLRARLTERVTLGELAAIVDCSPYHFARAFRNTVGCPPHRYLIRLRIDQARTLLRETDWSIIQVATAVGYESQSSFSRAFRIETGCSPLSFRRDAG